MCRPCAGVARPVGPAVEPPRIQCEAAFRIGWGVAPAALPSPRRNAFRWKPFLRERGIAPRLRIISFQRNALLRQVAALCRSAQFSLPVDAMIARETLSRSMQWLGFLELAMRLASYKNISISFGEVQASLAGLPIFQLVQSAVHALSSVSVSCRPSNSPVGTMPKPKHPL